MGVVLHGYRFSVYTRVAQLALIEKGVQFQNAEIDPFDPDHSDALAKLSPFGCVPILDHDGMRLYETLAITQYVDDAFDGPALVPSEVKAKARMFQVISIVNSYAYWPLVRQVFSHRVFRPLMGEVGDDAVIAEGLAASDKVLAALDAICDEALVLDLDQLTLADAFLAPTIDYFCCAPEGAKALARHKHLANWWAVRSGSPSVCQTRPDFVAVE